MPSAEEIIKMDFGQDRKNDTDKFHTKIEPGFIKHIHLKKIFTTKMFLLKKF